MRIKTTEHIKDMKYKRVKGGFFYGEKWVAVDDLIKELNAMRDIPAYCKSYKWHDVLQQVIDSLNNEKTEEK